MTDDVQQTLQSLGLTKSESRLYMAILELGTTNVSQLSQTTGINRRNIYDSLSTLLDKGLIFEIVREHEGHYAAIAPEKLAGLIESKAIDLQGVMPDLLKQFRSSKTREDAVIYKGIEGFKKYLRDILKEGQPIYCLGAKGGWGYKKLGTFANQFERERTTKKLKAYNLFDHEMRPAIGSTQPAYNRYAEHRFLPKDFSTNSAIDVFGDRVVIFTGLTKEAFDDDVTLFSFTSHELANAFRTWFQLMWEAAAKT